MAKLTTSSSSTMRTGSAGCQICATRVQFIIELTRDVKVICSVEMDAEPVPSTTKLLHPETMLMLLSVDAMLEVQDIVLRELAQTPDCIACKMLTAKFWRWRDTRAVFQMFKTGESTNNPTTSLCATNTSPSL